MRGFDKNFWFGAVVFIALIAFSFALAKLFQLSFVLVFLGAVVLLWVVLDARVKRLLRTSPKEDPIIYCEWEDRINELDFDANQESTRIGFEEIGLTLNQAVGKTYSFHTEPSTNIGDLYFEGIVIRDDTNKIVIRALKALPIKNSDDL